MAVLENHPGDPALTLVAGLTAGQSTRLPAFFLRELTVVGFRAIRETTFSFQPGLNVIIGANNAAKTAAIDALRLLFGLGSYEKREDTVRLRSTDVCIDAASPPPEPRQIGLTTTFYGRKDAGVEGQFYELLCPDESAELADAADRYAVFRLSYQVDFRYVEAKSRYEIDRGSLRGGPTLSHPVPYEVMDSIRAVYLAPLRDLIKDRAHVGAEIERLLISHTLPDREDERRGIPGQLQERLEQLISEVTGNSHNKAASSSFASYAKLYGVPDDSLSFVPSGISDDLFRAMAPVFAHGLHGKDGLPLGSNGLGINQLIYASIVLSRRGVADADRHVHRFFVIEEPEAHLHPQLQDSFFHALNSINDHQIFVTSHSPTITAKTDIDKIIVMRRDAVDGPASPLHLAHQFRDRPQDKRYLHKFLDVTRSQLLFARGAVFVEGVTEALLLQRFSELMGCSLRDHGIEIVPIGSSNGYAHFRPLFADAIGPYYRAVFITDGDEKASQVRSDDEFRNDTAFALDAGLQHEGATATATGYGTFEFGLLRTAVAGAGHPDMLAVLHAALAAAAPPEVVNGGNVDAFIRDFLDADRPALAYQKMKANTKGQPLQDEDWHAGWHTNSYFKSVKSEFAFHLHEALSSLPDEVARSRFTVPAYIRNAIEYVTNTDVQPEAGGARAAQ